MAIINQIKLYNDYMSFKQLKEKAKVSTEKFFSSKYFLVVIIAFFFTQVVFYSASIKYGIPPDERYHFTFVDVYSENPLLNGPMVETQSAEVSILGDVTRSPNYLYHYLLSFPLRIIKMIGLNFDIQIFSLRLINGLMSVFSLLVLIKIFKSVKLSDSIINFSIFILTQIGMFVWLSASVNYDNLAILMSLLTIYQLILLFSSPDFYRLLTIFTLCIAILLIKTVAILFVAIFILLAVINEISHNKSKTYISKFLKSLNPSKNTISTYKRVVVLFPFIIFLCLFTERFVANYFTYGSFSVSCSKVQKEEICLQNAVYARNKQLKENYSRLVEKEGKPVQNPFLFMGDWLYLMYERIFFYTGHKRMQPNSWQSNVAIVSMLVLVVILITNGIDRKNNLRLFAASSILYVIAVALYNLNTLNRVGEKVGFQGRYLLIVLPFLLMAALGSIFDKKVGRLSQAMFLSVIVLFLFNHNPTTQFFINTDKTWYTKSFNNLIGEVDNTPVPEL